MPRRVVRRQHRRRRAMRAAWLSAALLASPLVVAAQGRARDARRRGDEPRYRGGARVAVQRRRRERAGRLRHAGSALGRATSRIAQRQDCCSMPAPIELQEPSGRGGRCTWPSRTATSAIVDLLLSAGADAKLADNAGRDAPDARCARRRRCDRSPIAARRRARRCTRPEYGQTALMVAVREGHADVVRAAAGRGRRRERADARRRGAGISPPERQRGLERRRHHPRRLARARHARARAGREDAAALRDARGDLAVTRGCSSRPVPSSNGRMPTA